MTDKLTPEQRKRVAEAVTGNTHRIDDDVPGRVVAFVSDYWNPGNKLWQWKALSQFLALQYQFKGDDLQDELFVACIADNNTEGLERMVYEILEPQDD